MKRFVDCIVLYGRRRVGKTELLSEFIKGKRALYFLATEESIVENRNSFRLAVAEFTQQGLLRSGNQFSWDVLFEQTAQAGTDDEKVIIVLDEFQYLGKAEKAFPSILQRTWDTQLRNKRVMLILCGSLISMMEEQALSYSRPLYGRRTAQFKLQQIPFSYYHEFFADAAPMDGRRLIEYYSVTGGVPSCGGTVISMRNRAFCSRTKFRRWALTFPSSKPLPQEIGNWARSAVFWKQRSPI